MESHQGGDSAPQRWGTRATAEGGQNERSRRFWLLLLALGAAVPAILAVLLFVQTWQINDRPGPADSGDAAVLQAYAGAAGLLTTAILVVVTGAYVILTAEVAKETGRSASATAESVRVGRDEVEQMREQVKIGQRQLDQATLVRIDQQAPRVVALPAAKSSWPPFAERPSTKNVRPLEGPIVLPSRNSGQAWFATRVLLRNEGSTTGIISLPDDDSMRFANDGGAFGRARVAEPVRVSGGLFALTPGHEALLEITSCATFAHLADLADPTVDPPIVSAHNITILDYFRETVLTNIRFELRGRPLEKVPDDPGRWRPTERLAIDPTPVVTMGVWIDRHRASQV